MLTAETYFCAKTISKADIDRIFISLQTSSFLIFHPPEIRICSFIANYNNVKDASTANKIINIKCVVLVRDGNSEIERSTSTVFSLRS